MGWHQMFRRVGFLGLGLFLLLGYINCSQQAFQEEDSWDANSSSYASITLSPASQTITINSIAQFYASGGTSPYAYALASGSGTVNASTGVYTAPNFATTATILVTDQDGLSATATVTVTSASSTPSPTSPLSLSAAPSTIYVQGSSYLTASGGTPPYTYSVTSGTGVLTGTRFLAPYAAETDTVTVSDATGAVATATITVYDPNATTAISTAPVYRLYQSASGQHFYSLDPNEATGAGYVLEMQAFKVMTSAPSSRASWTLVRCIMSNGNHFVSNISTCEGIGTVEGPYGYIYSNFELNSVPLYRFYKAANGDRLTTTNLSEGYVAGYGYEGILGYVPQ